MKPYTALPCGSTPPRYAFHPARSADIFLEYALTPFHVLVMNVQQQRAALLQHDSRQGRRRESHIIDAERQAIIGCTRCISPSSHHSKSSRPREGQSLIVPNSTMVFAKILLLRQSTKPIQEPTRDSQTDILPVDNIAWPELRFHSS
jgi:hypothetical protein